MDRARCPGFTGRGRTRSKRSLRSYRGLDRREVPAYPLREAAHYLRLPTTTLRQWVCGRTVDGRRDQGVIDLPGKVGGAVVLSFNNLVECHILASLRREHEVPLSNIRSALRYVRKELGSKHPLLQQQFETNGVDLFVEHLGVARERVTRGSASNRLKLPSAASCVAVTRLREPLTFFVDRSLGGKQP